MLSYLLVLTAQCNGVSPFISFSLFSFLDPSATCPWKSRCCWSLSTKTESSSSSDVVQPPECPWTRALAVCKRTTAQLALFRRTAMCRAVTPQDDAVGCLNAARTWCGGRYILGKVGRSTFVRFASPRSTAVWRAVHPPSPAVARISTFPVDNRNLTFN